FSPDRGWIAYTGMPGGVLWRSRLDGSEKVQLTVNPMRAAMPRWSPDGKEIAFMGRNPETPWKVMVVSRDGGNLREVISDGGNQADPSWSPDGTSLAFGRIPSLEGSPDAAAIHIVDLKTDQCSTVLGSMGLFSPRWSPDGRSIAAVTADSKRLVLFDLKQKQWSDLTTLAEGSAGYPNWSRNSTHVYFLHFGVAEAAIVRVRASDRKVERVASLKTVRQPTTTFGTWVGLTPDDAPLVTRDLSSQQIYAVEWEIP
ncbi:MAG: CadC family transcriptional regulator, partial [Acidobacteria bacterium]|nr:CadC family transcriptional regulator [Acidobacteriota bacterium]